MTAYSEAVGRRVAVGPQARPAARRTPRMRSWILFSLAVIVAFFGLIFSRISLDRSAFLLEDLEEHIAQEQSRQGALRVEVARLQSPERISRLAAEMGLTYPVTLVSLEAPQIIRPLQPEDPWARLPSVQAARP